METEKVVERIKSSRGSGMGLFGFLIILGLMGMGPCADDCRGCGPTLSDVVKCDCQCDSKD